MMRQIEMDVYVGIEISWVFPLDNFRFVTMETDFVAINALWFLTRASGNEKKKETAGEKIPVFLEVTLDKRRYNKTLLCAKEMFKFYQKPP